MSCPHRNVKRMARLRGQIGATLVEYSLIFALVLVGSLGAIQFLTAQSEEETLNQVDCVAERPPRDSCQIPAIVTTTTIEGDPPPPTDPGDPLPPPGSSSFGDFNPVLNPDGTWTVQLTLTVSDPEVGPIEGALVTFGVQVPPTLTTHHPQCTTGGDGTCTVAYTVTNLLASTITVSVYDIASNAVLSSSPEQQTVARPT